MVDNTSNNKQQKRSYTYEQAKATLTKKLALAEFEMARIIDLSSRKKSMKWSNEKYSKMARRLERARSEKNKLDDMLIELDKKAEENTTV
jgi:hypothetical protein